MFIRSRPLRAARSGFAASLAAVLILNLLQVPALAAGPAPYQRPTPVPVPKVPVTEVPVRSPSTVPARPDASAKPAPVWPAAGSAVVAVPAGTGRAPAQAGSLPVRVAAAPAVAGSTAGPPARVRVDVLDRATTARAGLRGLALRLARADGITGFGPTRVSIDYAPFATAYGADWSSRLRLVSLPECALTTPQQRNCVGTPLRSTKDLAKRTVTADVPVGAGSLFALTAADSGPSGDYAATPLQASATWSAGGNSGTFAWSYPMRVPPAMSGLAPKLALAYSSQSVDGRHAASNNQPSWVGEGFELSGEGFIERRYKPCLDDMDGSANNDEETGDLCWETDNATLTLGGSSGELIYNATEQRWHLRNDDGSRIERKSGASNGDNNGEHWVVTTTSGIQYWFGKNRLPGWVTDDPETNSTWTVPVFGNDPNEPCHATAFADSDCRQAWRWNLDYVVDLSGNSYSYWYTKETNKYGRNLDPDDEVSYDRGGWLDRIDYGTRRVADVDSVLDTPAPFRIELGDGNRCLSDCTTHDETHWPDTPWDRECTGTSCPENFSPTFWRTKRLSTVTTQIRSGTGYADVERWNLIHTFPDPGDGTRAGLWLDRISHTGLAGGTAATLPDVEFTPVQLANRVDTRDFAAAMNWMRITKIRNETGGTLNLTYSEPDCVAGQTPTPHTNNRLCYPVIWTPEGYPAPRTDWFHKYVIKKIFEIDHTGGVAPQGSPRVIRTYDYLDGAAWHYADDEGLIEKEEKTWSDYRGYGKVTETIGDPGEQTYTETRYFRGMHGDRAAPAGGTRTVTVDGINDEDWYAGVTRETRTLNGVGGPTVSRQTMIPWASSPATATRTINGDTVTARFSRVATVTSYTTLDAGRGERATTVTTGYDSYGMAVSVDDSGEDGKPGDEQCTKTDYTPRNDTNWLMDRVHRTQKYALKCADTGGTLTAADVIGETRTWYDNSSTFEATPTAGLPTRVEEMADWNSGAPTFTTVTRTAYDAHGRVTSSWDAMNYETKTAYTPTLGGPVTATTLTNPLGHKTTTTLDPAWASETSVVDPNDKRTDLTYDGLGRLTAVWLPGRDKATDSANVTFGYTVRNDASTVLATNRLNAQGAYVTSYAMFDGLLRPRQTQAPSPSGGRLLTDTFYDSAGRPARSYGIYHAAGTPGTTLATATEAAFVPNQSRNVYDGTGRITATVFQPYAAERWRTTTYYAGDRTDTTPPSGGTASASVTDVRGRTVELRQYHGAVPTPATAGSWDATTYAFNRKGQLEGVTDPAGNDWAYTYDIRGRKTGAVDPDTGSTSLTYDNAGRITLSTDARSRKLAYGYDPLNRKRAVYENQIGGTPRAQWVYDTVAKGQLSQSVRYVGSAQYVYKVTAYSDTYQPEATEVVIPASETGLAGTYTSDNSWNVDGSLASTTLPATNVNDLPAETLSYGYDSLGLPTTLSTLYGSTNSSYVADTDYNALGQPEQYELYTGTGGRVFQAFTRELETGRLTGARTDRDSATPNIIADRRYTFDPAGNITGVKDVAADPVDDTQCFGHDHLRRLSQAWTPTSGDCSVAPNASLLGGPAPYWHSWTFDSSGNRKTQSVHSANGAAVTDYHYPAAGGARPHSLTSTSGAQSGSYTYDLSGNTLTRPTTGAGTQTLVWDAEGDLETSTDATGQTRYIYDADGNRLVRRDPAGRTLYLPGQEIRYNTASGTTTCTRYYGFAGSTLASRTAAGLTWLSADHQGTSLVAVDAGSQQVTQRRQTPYGTARGGVPGWPNSRGFVGGTVDNTGLTHLGAREYDPTIGRFISVDPIQDLNDPVQWNGYTYSNNTPVTMSDPSGLLGSASCAPGMVGGPGACTGNENGPGISPGSTGGYHTSIKTYPGGTTVTRSNGRTWINDFEVPEEDLRHVPDAPTVDQMAAGLDRYHSEHPVLEEGWVDRYSDEVTRAGLLLATNNGYIKGSGQFKLWVHGVSGQITPELGGMHGIVGPRGPRGGPGPRGPRVHGCNSFAGDTEVLLAAGDTKPLEEIEVGDVVLATDPETGEQGPRTVTAVWVHDDELRDLEVTGGRLRTTEDHPYWNVTDQQWQLASELDPGDLLRAADGSEVEVFGFIKGGSRVALAYNLTVDDIHTYYVVAGKTPVLVHNTGPCLGPVQNPSRGSTARRDHVDWEEDLLLEVRHNPAAGERLVKVPQTDPRWPADKGWQKMTQTIDGVEIHYQYQATTGAVDDLKVKDWVPGAAD
ncbi:RHS repeat-associated core domain-containing protein [Micromonospora sp. NPDC049051]|uniref:RHS repeat-associated core domain-containing protein n=1 Tax=Micromonospora sp. NPDC049051 TaxID=3364264 RepID=UPI00371EB552